jgi:hypothetical protein
MKRWKDWINLALGLAVFASPWVLEHPMGPAGASPESMWNLWVVGLLISGAAFAAAVAFRPWQESLAALLGAWLLFSPWVLGYSDVKSLAWAAVIAGALVVTLAIRSLPLGDAGVRVLR